MSHFFLRSKHYLLFFPLIIPTLLSFYFQVEYMAWITEMQQEMIAAGPDGINDAFDIPNLANYKGYFVGFLFITGLAAATKLGWWYNIGTELEKYLPTGTNLKSSRLKLAIGVMATLVLVQLIALYVGFDWAAGVASEMSATIQAGGEPTFPDPGEFMGPFLMIFGLFFLGGIISFAANVYSAYYVGKTLRCIEKDKALQGSDIAGYAVLSYFLMIGIWILQPKVNRLMETGRMDEPGKEDW